MNNKLLVTFLLLMMSWVGVAETIKPIIKETDFTVDQFKLLGKIDGDNLTYVLSFHANTKDKQAKKRILSGDLVIIKKTLSNYAKLHKTREGYELELTRKGDAYVSIEFALKVKKGKWHTATVLLPQAEVRPFEFSWPLKDDLNISCHGSIRGRISKDKVANHYSGFLGNNEVVTLSWHKKIQLLETEMAIMARVLSQVDISNGALKQNHLYKFKLVQGKLTDIRFRIPKDLSVVRVMGSNIQDWKIEKLEGGKELSVKLNRPQEGSYNLWLDCEMSVAAFPITIDMPVPQIKNVIRANGLLSIGTSNAIKLHMDQLSGLSQVESQSFLKETASLLQIKKKSKQFYYSFADQAYSLKMKASSIRPTIFCEDKIFLSLKEGEALMKAELKLDIRDAGIRELEISLSKGLSISNIRASKMSDYDLVKGDKVNTLKLYFKVPLIGKIPIELTLEYSLSNWDKPIAHPWLKVNAAETERGLISIAVEDGYNLELTNPSGIRRVPLNSTGLTNAGVIQAWRYKNSVWQGQLQLKKKESSVNSEIFHLYTIGDNVLYGTSSVSIHISGAPANTLKFKIPKGYKNVEFLGKHSPKGENVDEIWTVKLKKKITGDYTLLISYDMTDGFANSLFKIGHLESVDTESESGYISISGSSEFKLSDKTLDKFILPIEADEIPAAYRMLHQHQILKAYKYDTRPHQVELTLDRYEQAESLRLVIEHANLSTKINANGEQVSTVKYWLKNNSHQHLNLRLPKGAKLWSTKVDGRAVRSTVDGDTLMIPISPKADQNDLTAVELVYAEQNTILTHNANLTLLSPQTAVEIIYNQWTIDLPERYSLESIQGNMQAHTKEVIYSSPGILDQIITLNKGIITHPRRFMTLLSFTLAIAVIITVIIRRKMKILLLTAALLIACAPFMIFKNAHFKQLIVQHETAKPALSRFVFRKTLSVADESLELSAMVFDKKIEPVKAVGPSVPLSLLALLFLVPALWKRNFILLGFSFISLFFACQASTFAAFIFAAFITLLIPAACLVCYARLLKRFKPKEEPKEEGYDPSISRAGSRLALILASFLLISSFQSVEAASKKEKKVVQKQIQKPAEKKGFFASFFGIFKSKPKKKVNKLSTITHVDYQILAENDSATVKARFKIDAVEGKIHQMLYNPYVLIKTNYDSKNFKLEKKRTHYELLCLNTGEFELELEFMIPVFEINKVHNLNLKRAKSFTHNLHLELNDLNVDLSSPSSLYYKAAKLKGKQTVDALFSDTKDVEFIWRPKQRELKNEETRFMVDSQSLAIAGEGSIDLTHRISIEISRGLLRKLKISVPENQSVTSVTMKDLHNWAYDPEKNILDLQFSRAISGSQNLDLSTQIKVKKQPYEVSIELPQLVKAERQR
ncbi:MAG: hypothetical protein MJH11_07605, partial [Lentisphaeria bacterium]|nr:hypothetical protein [Lentisphaeria bacterium]